MGTVLVVTSGKGGVGKSTVCVGISETFCRNGSKVLLIDSDEGLRCLDHMLGVSDRVMLDLSDAQTSCETAEAACLKVEGTENLYLLAAPLEFGKVEPEKFGETIVCLSEKFDVVIVDCPAGIDERYYSGLPKNSKILVVTNSDAAAVNGAMKAGMMIRRLGFTQLRLIVNKFTGRHIGSVHDNIDMIVDKTGIGLIGIIPYDEEVINAASKSRPVRYGRAAMAFSRIAARINGVKVLLPKTGKI